MNCSGQRFYLSQIIPKPPAYFELRTLLGGAAIANIIRVQSRISRIYSRPDDSPAVQVAGNHRNQLIIQSAQINSAFPVGTGMNRNHGLGTCHQAQGLRFVEIVAGYMQAPVIAGFNAFEAVAVESVPGDFSGNI